MKDAEFIYSLYVQANPVPDPDLLPLTRDEAVLLNLERSPDMITQEQVEKRQPEVPPRRKRLVPALAAAGVLLVAVLAAGILMSRDSATPVAAIDANPVVVFDGTTCRYDGPTLIEEGEVQFTFENSADEAFYPIALLVEEPALARELELHPVGTDIETTNEGPDGIAVIQGRIRPGATGTESQLSTWLEPGTYLFDCGTGLGPDRVWRAAQLEVVAP